MRSRRIFQIMPGAQWLNLLLQHVPDRNEHLVRYYGWYSNRSRGNREKAEVGCAAGSAKRVPAQRKRGADQPETGDELETRSSWARLIRKVYRVDPLICPRCGGRMRLIALIEEPAVIEWPDTDHLWPPAGYRLSSC